jgi:hypothetical protein
MMDIGKIENNWFEAKCGLRELIETITPYEEGHLELLMKDKQKLVDNAVHIKVKQDGF